MTQPAGTASPRVAIVGGGLAGLAATVGLSTAGCAVELFESRRRLGGRAASFRDPATGQLIDHCQHVSMGCCTNLAQFCRQTGIERFFRSDAVLYVIGPQGQRCTLKSAWWLPAPLHFVPALLRLSYLSWADRWRIALNVGKLMRIADAEGQDGPSMRDWLRAHGQSARAIDQFWGVILVSALGESLDRVSVSAARKVLVDGFLASPEAAIIKIPQAPLGELYGQRLLSWLNERDVKVHLGSTVRRVSLDEHPILQFADGIQGTFDYVVVAVPWHQVADLFDPKALQAISRLDAAVRLGSAPIAGVHLWFDRPITDLPHAVLVGRLSQWLFSRGYQAYENGPAQCGHYYQVVISAAHELAGRDRDHIVAHVVDELAGIWPAAREARLLHARVVNEPLAVFSAAPGVDACRPAQETHDARLTLAGDWTATGWPATMESAVRSGYLAAEAVLKALGRPRRLLAADLPRGLLLRCLVRPSGAAR